MTAIHKSSRTKARMSGEERGAMASSERFTCWIGIDELTQFQTTILYHITNNKRLGMYESPETNPEQERDERFRQTERSYTSTPFQPSQPRSAGPCLIIAEILLMIAGLLSFVSAGLALWSFVESLRNGLPPMIWARYGTGIIGQIVIGLTFFILPFRPARKSSAAGEPPPRSPPKPAPPIQATAKNGLPYQQTQ